MTHTPGPWNSFNAYGNRGGCFAADGVTLVAHLPSRMHADTHRLPLPAEADANFRLIDAAPDMQAALLPFSFCDPDAPPPGVKVEDWRPAVLAARAAIDKSRATPAIAA